MPVIPNPYVTDPAIAIQPLPFLLDAAKFQRDLYGSHHLPEVEPLEAIDEIDFDVIAQVLRRYA